MLINGGNFTGRIIDFKDEVQNYESSLNMPFNDYIIMIISSTYDEIWAGEIAESKIIILKDGLNVTGEFFNACFIPGSTESLLAVMAEIARKTNALETGGELLASNKG